MKKEEQEKNKERWEALIQEQQSSSLSQAQFCHQKGIDPRHFSYYRIKLVNQNQSKDVGQKTKFAKVNVISNPTIKEEAVRIMLPNGLRCELPLGLTTMEIQRWLGALRSC